MNGEHNAYRRDYRHGVHSTVLSCGITRLVLCHWFLPLACGASFHIHQQSNSFANTNIQNSIIVIIIGTAIQLPVIRTAKKCPSTSCQNRDAT